ncbi:MAG: dihydroorotate dehydrogenase electron transfer subunit [Thermoguttaceae bacterium]|nr:dihydroorotate dehydrogenase electron transfer subunit [Thermoguttaceae bacterium]
MAAGKKCAFEQEHPNLRTGTGTVTGSRPVAAATWMVEFTAPELAGAAEPGQFVMLRLPGLYSPLLGRPFAVYQTDRASGRVRVIYLVVGNMTGKLSRIETGTPIEWWGPLGGGWAPIEKEGRPAARRIVMAAGGIGYTPFYMLAEKYAALDAPPELLLLYGARSRDRVPDLGDFEKLGVDVRLATDDGTAGRKGTVADLLREKGLLVPGESLVAACGPRPMLAAVFETARKSGNTPCWTSLETPMSCGMGLCFGCVIEYRGDDGKTDSRRTCVDGPVFDAYRLVWD